MDSQSAEHFGEIYVAEANPDLSVDLLGIGREPCCLRRYDIIGGEHTLLISYLRRAEILLRDMLAIVIS